MTKQLIKKKPARAWRLGVPFKEYAAIKAVNSTGIKRFIRDPAVYQYFEANPQADKDTPAMMIGRGFHCRILEPADYEKRFAVWREGQRRGTAFDEFKALHAGAEILNAAESEVIEGMTAAVMAHPIASKYFEHDDPRGASSEITLQWIDARTGLRCKARLDRIALGAVADLKSTTDARVSTDQGRGPFYWQSLRNEYFTQLAFYSDGAAACGLGVLNAVIVAVEKDPPYLVRVIDLAESALFGGRLRYEKALDGIKARAWLLPPVREVIEDALPDQDVDFGEVAA